MAETTHIEWTDATWNIITGCTLVDEGCRHCYAARFAATRLKHHPSRAGLARLNAQGEAKFTGEVRFNDQWLDQPLRWTKPRRIFVCAHGDLFHENVPVEWIDKVFAVMALAPQHTFQVLTKRPDRMLSYLMGFNCDGARRFNIAHVAGDLYGDEASAKACNRQWPLPNVWLGTSISDQPSWDARWPELAYCPAAVRFISAEPLLGPLEMIGAGKLDWLIVGGESGPKARPMHPDWARSLRDQCQMLEVAFFFKQWGEWTSALQIDGTTAISSAPPKDGHFAHPHRRRVHGGALDGQCFEGTPKDHNIIRVGKARAGRLLDGQEWSQMPGVKP